MEHQTTGTKTADMAYVDNAATSRYFSEDDAVRVAQVRCFYRDSAAPELSFQGSDRSYAR